MNHAHFLARLALCLLLTAGSVQAAPTATVATRGSLMAVNAVDSGVFHVVVSPSGAPAPPVSPFVVERTPWPGAVIRRDAGDATRVQTPQGAIHVGFGGRIRLQDHADRALVSSGAVTEANGTITLTLTHDPRERFYGAGNESENHAGDLTHPSGTQIVNNGTTRIPFLWSTGGWSVLVANNQTGMAWHDQNGILTWTIPGPDLDLYLGVAPNGYGLLDAYSRLTGRAPIPPRWTFGFLLSRWGYSDAADVQDKWHQFRDRQNSR